MSETPEEAELRRQMEELAALSEEVLGPTFDVREDMGEPPQTPRPPNDAEPASAPVSSPASGVGEDIPSLLRDLNLTALRIEQAIENIVNAS